MIAEDLGAFLADFGEELVFVREVEESSSSSSSSSTPDTPVITATLIVDTPPFEFAVYDRSFYDEKHYAAIATMEKARALGVETELVSVQINDKTTRNGQDFYVIGKVPDGTGMITLSLSHSRIDPA